MCGANTMRRKAGQQGRQYNRKHRHHVQHEVVEKSQGPRRMQDILYYMQTVRLKLASGGEVTSDVCGHMLELFIVMSSRRNVRTTVNACVTRVMRSLSRSLAQRMAAI